MNAVEIEEAISELAASPFDPEEFPFAFLEAFGNKATAIKRLRSGASNKSDIGGVLQTSNIHIKVCPEGQVSDTLRELRQGLATKNSRNRVKFILATDGKRAGRGALKLLKRPARFCGCLVPIVGVFPIEEARKIITIIQDLNKVEAA